jgi:diguanylate cyclase (GGDEF)-like protein
MHADSSGLLTKLRAMLARNRVNAELRTRRARRGGLARALAQLWLVIVLVALLVGLAGGRDGFWLGMPAILLAGSLASSVAGVLIFALPVLATDAVVASAIRGGSLPPVSLVVLVPLASLLVLNAMGRRLRRERDAMERAAYSDPLTGLANRRMLLARAEHEIARHRRTRERFTVVMLDLDGFKGLNDRYGHAAGDEMLREVAGALTGALRSQDTVARLGGDEFCVIAPQTARPAPLAEKIRSAVADAALGHAELRTSVGLAVFPDDGTAIDMLLRTADERLLAAKRRRLGGAQRRAA